MNAIAPTIIAPAIIAPNGISPVADRPRIGEVTAAWRITAGAMMVLGWRGDQPAVHGTVTPHRPGPRTNPNPRSGDFQGTAWHAPDAAETMFGFVLAVRLPPGEEIRAGEMLLLNGHDEPGGIVARLPSRFLEAEEFGEALARASGASGAAIGSFLLGTFAPAATRGNADIHAMLRAFLHGAATQDGCVEIAGAIEDRCAILQGWGEVREPECQVILIGAAIERHAAHVALFARPDLQGKASGQILVLPGAAPDLARLDAVVLMRRDGLVWWPVLASRRVLTDPETIGHLRDVLPALRCEPAVLGILRHGLRPRYQGRFTLYDGGHPVRIAVDLAVAASGAGLYLTGWLYDPASVVAGVTLCGGAGGSVPLDRNWIRIAREDVTDAFRHDPALPPNQSGQHGHGFAVHAAAVDNAGTLWLDIAFRDGECGFVPLTVETAGNAACRGRLMASVDLFKPSGMAIVENHLAPFLAGAAVGGETVAPDVVAPIPAEWTTAIVVPLDDSLPRALLSRFMRDPLCPDEGVVFVFGDKLTDVAARSLRALAEFYGVSPAMLRVRGSATPVAALTAVASVAKAGSLLLLDAGTVGRSSGWRAALRAAHDRASCLSPTVVYEDESIRFSGVDEIEALDDAPYVTIRRRLAGMPICLATVGETRPSVTASLACCLIPTDAVRRLGTGDDVATTSSMQEADLFRRLARHGAPSRWTPGAQVYATDRKPANESENDRRVARLVDGWCLRARLMAER